MDRPADRDAWDEQRASAPLGSTVEGTVVQVPAPGRIGVFVDLGLPTGGFVDVLSLPRDPEAWPIVGATGPFAVVQHRYRQIRLLPLDPAWRRADLPFPRHSAEGWEEMTRRYPVGAHVEMTVTQVFTGNRECWVSDGHLAEGVEWSGTAPAVGARRTYRVEHHLDPARRVILVDRSVP